MMPLSAVAPLIARRVGMRTMFVGGIGLIATGLALMALDGRASAAATCRSSPGCSSSASASACP